MIYLVATVSVGLALWLTWRLFRPPASPFTRLARSLASTGVAFAALAPVAASAIRAAADFEDAMNRLIKEMEAS